MRSDKHRVFDAIPESVFLENLPDKWAVQGELFGPGIQKNPLDQDKVRFLIHNVFNHGIPVPRSEWTDWMVDNSVPVRAQYNPEVGNIPSTIDEMIEKYDGIRSLVNPGSRAEGVVLMEWQGHVIPGMSRPNFKVISNTYLLKGK